jgi:2,4-dienoyl-CoA reductase-like NADH-dependent reductase (Old Yellow Enzyme family)
MNVPGKQNRHVMTESDIADVIRAFAEGARDAKVIGCDAVELHCAHGYLPDQFLWEGTNQRADQYGGSMENRARFVVEIIKACRAEVGTEFPIIMRWSQWKQQDYTVKLVDTPEQLETFLSPFVDAGVDVFHCSTRRFWEPEFEGSDLNLAGWTKKLTGKPTITVGSVGLNADFLPQPGETAFRSAEPASLDELISRIENNEFDVVAVGRALIANPEWPALVKAGRFTDLESYSSKMLMSLK